MEKNFEDELLEMLSEDLAKQIDNSIIYSLFSTEGSSLLKGAFPNLSTEESLILIKCSIEDLRNVEVIRASIERHISENRNSKINEIFEKIKTCEF